MITQNSSAVLPLAIPHRILARREKWLLLAKQFLQSKTQGTRSAKPMVGLPKPKKKLWNT
jgi:hypothetical protein